MKRSIDIERDGPPGFACTASRTAGASEKGLADVNLKFLEALLSIFLSPLQKDYVMSLFCTVIRFVITEV
jgi:hypothetical protein